MPIIKYIIPSLILMNPLPNLIGGIYEVHKEKTEQQAIGYSKTCQSRSRYLAFRDIPDLITSYVKGGKTLDYGAGTGLSALFLQELGLDVEGVDISQEMLKQAKVNCPTIPFSLMENNQLPYKDARFDLVFSGWVLFELSSGEKIVKYLKEAKRVMKQDAIFIAVTGSQDMFSKDWLIYDTDYPENQHPQSGDLLRVFSRDVDIEFTDYFWTKSDYEKYFLEAGLSIIQWHYPLGKEEELIPWRDEKTTSPYVIIIARKI